MEENGFIGLSETNGQHDRCMEDKKEGEKVVNKEDEEEEDERRMRWKREMMMRKQYI